MKKRNYKVSYSYKNKDNKYINDEVIVFAKIKKMLKIKQKNNNCRNRNI